MIASKTIKIFKKNIAKKLGPSPRSRFEKFSPQLHLSFIRKKLRKIVPLPHSGQQQFCRIYIKERFFFTEFIFYFQKFFQNFHQTEKKCKIKQYYLNV